VNNVVFAIKRCDFVTFDIQIILAEILVPVCEKLEYWFQVWVDC